jgi:hypothetical protein
LAIDRYLTLGYVPTLLTAFVGIRPPPAAHYLDIDAPLAEPELVRYWRFAVHAIVGMMAENRPLDEKAPSGTSDTRRRCTASSS